MKRLVVLRRTSQGIFFGIFTYILWSTTYPLTGAIPPKTFFFLDPLAIFMTSIGERAVLKGMGLAAAMLGLTFVAGRFFCGWICPLGSSLDFIRRCSKIEIVKNIKDHANAALRLPKYVLLAVIAFFAVMGTQIAWFLDPIVISARFVSLNLIPALTITIDRSFIFVIKNFQSYGLPYDLYRDLKASFLGINVYYFAHTWVTFLFFLIISCSGILLSRLWCRSVCPLGAMYALTAAPALLGRVVDGCAECGRCKSGCRMGAIKDDRSYVKGECILCMDCIYDCPAHITKFTWKKKKA